MDNQWVRVEDKLPDEGQYIIANFICDMLLSDIFGTHVTKFEGGTFWFVDYDYDIHLGYTPEYVKYWMPIPELPEEEE